jgi:hypothetical protein
VSEIKKSEKGQELLLEGKEIYQQISQSEQFKQLKEGGLSIVEAVVLCILIFFLKKFSERSFQKN